MQPLEGYQVEREAGRAVALALELDDELIREGLAREVVHAVQNARKDAGLEITDRIDARPRRRRGAARRRARPRGLRDRRDLATRVAYDGDGATQPITDRRSRSWRSRVERAD